MSAKSWSRLRRNAIRSDRKKKLPGVLGNLVASALKNSSEAQVPFVLGARSFALKTGRLSKAQIEYLHRISSPRSRISEEATLRSAQNLAVLQISPGHIFESFF